MRQKQSYHHKDLRNALIEKGIELVNTEGVQSFSLRKVAAACGVSHAAPYSHFQSKEDLLEAMQHHITGQFSELLEETIQRNEKKPELLKNMGIAYVSFFVDNPTYFQFLYSQSNIKIDLTLSIPDEENYRPYIIYKNVVLSMFNRVDYSKEKQIDSVIAIWAFIHGVAALATMENVYYNHSWKQKVVDFLERFQVTALNDKEGLE